jgi:competence protein ComEC
VVQSGDSLSGVALRFGVSVEQLMRANDLTDPDVLYLGQRLVIPAQAPTGVPAATASTPGARTPTGGASAPGTPQATGAPAPTATLGAEPVVKIDQVRKATAGSGDDVVVLSNSGGWAKLLGWTLVDAQGNAFTFPDLRLFPGGQVRVHTTSGKNTEVDLYWGVNRAAWSQGGTVTLKDASGSVVQVFTIQ